MKYITVTLLLMFIALPAFSMKENDTLSSSLALKNQNGVEQSFDTLKGEKGLILVFYRSAHWCPFCQKQLIELQENLTTIEATGYNLAGISYDDVSKLKRFSNKHSITFPLLSDEQSDAIKAFDLLSDQYGEDHFAYGVPQPAVVIINRDGSIRTVLKENGYKDRVIIDDIIKAVQ